MKTFYIIIIASVSSSCELETEDLNSIESRIEKKQTNSDQITDIEKLKEIYGEKEIVNTDSLYLEKFNKYEDPEYVYLTENTKHQTVNISKEECKLLGYAELSFSFEAPSEYFVEYFPDNGALVSLKFEKENTLISELSFTSLKFDKKYTLQRYKEDFNEFTNDESNKHIKASLLDNQYFGKKNLNTLMHYSAEKTPYENKILFTLGMIIPSLDNDLFLICSLTKPSINPESPFNKLEDQIFNTLVINAVPLNEIIEAYN